MLYSYNGKKKAVLDIFSVLGRSRNCRSVTKDVEKKSGIEDGRGIIFCGISIVTKNKTHTVVLYKLSKLCTASFVNHTYTYVCDIFYQDFQIIHCSLTFTEFSSSSI